MLYLDMSVTVQSVKKMFERLLIVVNYSFSNAPPLQSTKSEGAVRDVLFRTSILQSGAVWAVWNPE
jgi:hypothetical protein